MPEIINLEIQERVTYEASIPADVIVAAIRPGFEPGGFWEDEDPPTEQNVAQWLQSVGETYAELDHLLADYCDDAHVTAEYERQITSVDVEPAHPACAVCGVARDEHGNDHAWRWNVT